MATQPICSQKSHQMADEQIVDLKSNRIVIKSTAYGTTNLLTKQRMKLGYSGHIVLTTQ